MLKNIDTRARPVHLRGSPLFVLRGFQQELILTNRELKARQAVKSLAAKQQYVLLSAGRTPCPLVGPSPKPALTKNARNHAAANLLGRQILCACSLSFIINRSISVLLS